MLVGKSRQVKRVKKTSSKGKQGFNQKKLLCSKTVDLESRIFFSQDTHVWSIILYGWTRRITVLMIISFRTDSSTVLFHFYKL